MTSHFLSRLCCHSRSGQSKPSASPLRRVVRSPTPLLLLIVPTEPTTRDTVLPRKSPTRARRHSHMPYFQRFLSMDFTSALYKPPLPILDRQWKTVANNIPLLPAFIASRSSLHFPGHNDERSRRYAATVRFYFCVSSTLITSPSPPLRNQYSTLLTRSACLTLQIILVGTGRVIFDALCCHLSRNLKAASERPSSAHAIHSTLTCRIFTLFSRHFSTASGRRSRIISHFFPPSLPPALPSIFQGTMMNVAAAMQPPYAFISVSLLR